MVLSKDLGQAPKVGLAHKESNETPALPHIERLETAIFNISSAITAHQDLNKTLEDIAREALHCLKANRSTIFLIDPKSGNLKPQFTHALDPLDERVGFFEEREVAQKALEEKKPFLVGGRGKSSDSSKGQKHQRKIISLMSCPLSSRGETMGVASLVLVNEENGFDEKNMQFFSSFANLAAIAMEMSDLPEEGHKGKSLRIANEHRTENILDQLPILPQEESQRADHATVKIKAEQKAEGKRSIEGPNKEKIPWTMGNISMGKESLRSDGLTGKIKAEQKVDEKRTIESPNNEKIPWAPGNFSLKKENPRSDVPGVTIKAEEKVDEKRTIGSLNQEKIPLAPGNFGLEKENPRSDVPVVKKKVERKIEEPRVIEGPNKEKIAWAPGTVTLKEEAGIDRRREERIETTVRAEFQEEYWGYTKNLSNGGAFILTSNPLDLGDEILLKLHLPDGGEQIEVDCKVVWTNQYGRETQDLRRGMGVKFLNLQPGVQKRIQTYIEFEKNRGPRLGT